MRAASLQPHFRCGIHDQLFGLTDVEGEIIVLAPHCHITVLLPVSRRHVVSKLDDGAGVVCGHAVVGEQGVQEGTKHTLLWGPLVKGQHGRGDVAYPHHLGLTRQEVQDPVSEGGVQSQGPKLGDKFRGDNGVER